MKKGKILLGVVAAVVIIGAIGSMSNGTKPGDNSPTGDSGIVPENHEPVTVKTDDNNNESLTAGQKNALKKAKTYLSVSPFSRDGLVGQLEFEGYTHDEAVYGADNCGADWSEQALKKAKSYLDVSAFSYSGLIKQLEFEKFTNEQAKYGVDNCEADWFEQASLKAKSYLDIMAFSRSGLIDQLEFEGFTNEQAVYGAEQNGY